MMVADIIAELRELRDLSKIADLERYAIKTNNPTKWTTCPLISTIGQRSPRVSERKYDLAASKKKTWVK